ncbi:MAG: SH3 domain-containing protein [Lachnospiraceae bacterium]|nr:SH3 domain-containing protein [Lachnospiraceae bacterium]
MIILEGQKDIYMPVRQLSAGTGQAKTYLCENRHGGRFAAKIYPDMNGVGNAVRRFLYQADYPYLVCLLDHGVSEIQGRKCAFEIFEYMDQGTLDLKAPLDEYYVEKTVIPCLNEALHGMHEAGFLHRDVKPDNMYGAVSKEGTPCAKLGDFGISVPLGKDGSYCDAALAFTPGYVPAEVLGTGMYSPASDYYGLAVSIYYLLTGKQIYEGMKPDEIMIRTRRGELMHYEGVSRRMASLLEGLTVQDPRYRWGYKEVKAWISGANVPVFRYSQEEQILDPPYQLTARISCSSLRELAQALCRYPEEGRQHLYDGLLSDSLRRQYQHLSNALSDLTVNHFPHARNAGLTGAVHLIDPSMEGFFWDGRIYEGIFPLLQELRQEVARGSLSASSEELLTSGILSYYYADVFSEEDMTVVRSVEQEAAGNVMRAACELVLRLLPEAIYKPDDNTEIRDIDGYIGFLEKNPAGLKEQIYLDFNKDYFQCWLNVIGYSMAFREWRDFFYKGGRISQDGRIMGNVCQFLERICPERQSVLRRMVICELEREPEYWLKNHLDLYEMDEMMEHMVQENFAGVEYTEDMSIPELLRAEHELKEYMHELRRDFLNNPYLYELGVYDVADYRITSGKTDAYFVQNADYEFVPAGWLTECGSLQEKSIVQSGMADAGKEASDYLKQFSGRVNRWAEDCLEICRERRQKRQVPGVLGGFCSLLLGVFLLVFWGILTRNFLEGSGLISKAGFMLTFLAIVLCITAGVIRLDQFRLWKRLLRSIDNMKDIAEEARSMGEEVLMETSGICEEIPKASHNLEMEAQGERAYSGYLSAYRKMKNGLFRYFLIFILAAGVLGAGLYMDGSISPDKGSVVSQITSLFDKKGSEVKDNKRKQDSDTFTVSVSSARLRSGAGTSYEVLNSYERGTQVKATGKSQSDGSHIWYQVTTPDGTTGWMRDDMLSQ